MKQSAVPAVLSFCSRVNLSACTFRQLPSLYVGKRIKEKILRTTQIKSSGVQIQIFLLYENSKKVFMKSWKILP